MPGSPVGDTAAGAPVSAPPGLLLSRGHRVLIEAEVIDAFAEECRVAFRTGNLNQVIWVNRKQVVSVVGFDPALAELSDESVKAVNLAAALGA